MVAGEGSGDEECYSQVCHHQKQKPCRFVAVSCSEKNVHCAFQTKHMVWTGHLLICTCKWEIWIQDGLGPERPIFTFLPNYES